MPCCGNMEMASVGFLCVCSYNSEAKLRQIQLRDQALSRKACAIIFSLYSTEGDARAF